MKKSIILEIINALLIALWVYAAVSKLLDYSAFKAQLGKSPMLSNYVDIIGICLPVVELLIAIAFLFSDTKFVALYASLFLLVMFTSYLIVILNFSYYIPCSCGGILGHLSWKSHIIFNFFFILINALSTIYSKTLKTEASPISLHNNQLLNFKQ